MNRDLLATLEFIVFVIFIAFLFFIFQGDPDIWDMLVALAKMKLQ